MGYAQGQRIMRGGRRMVLRMVVRRGGERMVEDGGEKCREKEAM